MLTSSSCQELSVTHQERLGQLGSQPLFVIAQAGECGDKDLFLCWSPKESLWFACQSMCGCVGGCHTLRGVCMGVGVGVGVGVCVVVVDI
jgi:hypothetical protein